MRRVKTFEHFAAEKRISESSWKSLGLGEPSVLRPGISYEIEAFDVVEVSTVAELIVSGLKLKEGEIYWDRDEFVVSGITQSGNVLYLAQEGEFDMYGGPHLPRMRKPEITVNGRDLTEEVLKLISQRTESRDSNYPDITEVDLYGDFLNKPPQALQTYFTSKKFGL